MKFQLKIVLFLLILANIQVFAQHADCDKMLILKDTIYHTGAIAGFGDKKEFEGNILENNKTFETEKNSIWYFIKAPVDGVFTFDIITENESDDWDFLLYKYESGFCEKIANNQTPPIRTNLSRSPITGLSQKATEKFVGAGINSNYSKSVHINKGDRFALVVNNPKKKGGNHTLVLHFPHKKEIKPKEIKETLVEVVQTKFELVIKDKSTNDLVKSNISISGLETKTLEIENKSVYVQFLPKKNRSIHLSVAAKGYMFYDNQVKIHANKSTASFDILLAPIAVGSSVNLKQIQFYGNRFDMLPSAKPTLKALFNFMKSNPSVKIMVEGHVNGPRQKNSTSYQQLSFNRALAVKDYLITNGIDKERVDYKGYGNSNMLFPDPKSAYQEAANRRVEIKITAK